MTDLIAPITEVTVYADRALVTRRGSIHLPAGEQVLRINDLPFFLRESLRAAGEGPQGTRILDVDITTTFHSRPPETEIATLESACELLQQRINLIQARMDALNDNRQWLRALGEQSSDFARGLARGQMKPQDCADFFSFASTQALHNAELSQDLEIQHRQLSEELGAKQRELNSKQYGKPDRLAAVVTLDMASEGEFSLEISYLITQASWSPQYDVRVSMEKDGNSGEVELTYIGLVSQQTGENWDQVHLALSTARPSEASVLPELEPRYLNVYAPLPPPIVHAQPKSSGLARSMALVGSAAPSGAPQPFGGMADMLPAPTFELKEQALIATAEVEQSGTAYVFHIGRSVDIPSDNSPHKTTIARDNLPCSFDYVSAPVIESNVHLRATITNTSERVLLPGKSSIFLSGEYVGTTEIKKTAPREEFKIFLGIDDSINVKREQLERTVEKGALLQSDLRRITYAYRITLHNYSPFERNLVLRDQLPVSQHERIKVKTPVIQPVPTERTKQELLTWRFTLPADGEYKVEYRYTIEHPQDTQVTGLP